MLNKSRFVTMGLALLVGCGQVQIEPVTEGADGGADVGQDANPDALSTADGTQVNQAPKVSIKSPANDAVLSPGQLVHFSATISDDVDPPNKLAVKWHTADGTVLKEGLGDGSGVSEFDSDKLPDGPNKVICDATDSQGLLGTASIVVLVNRAPGAATVTILPAAPTTSDDLVVQITTPATDPDRASDELTYVYAWTKNGQPTEFKDKTLPASATAKGESWTVKVKAKDIKVEGAEATASVTILNAVPVAPVLAVTPTSVDLLSDVTCALAQEAVDADGDVVTYTWSWQVGDYLNPGADQQTAKVPNLKSGAAKGQKVKGGDTLFCGVVAKDSDGAAAPAVVSPQVVVNSFDICASEFNPCDPVATCENTNTLDPTCSCPDGFFGDGKICLDTDECASGDKCSADAVCTNLPGSFKCQCKSGFSGDGVSCTDNDECALDTDACDLSAECSNTAGSYACSCKPGFAQVATNASNLACAKKLCAKDVDACKNDGACAVQLACLVSCTDESCSGACVQAGIAPDLQKVVDCAGGAGCGKAVGFECHDVDECKDGTSGCSANANCKNQIGSVDCTCKAGFSGDGKTCDDINECLVNNGGCSENATCDNYEGGRFCICKPGYSGTGEVCSDIDECATGTNKCDPNALCVNNAGAYTCACKAGFLGDGYACTDIDECATPDFKCHSQGKCINLPGSAKCQCLPGYSGDGKVSCVDVDECVTGTAKCVVPTLGGVCINQPGSYLCQCASGYSGDGVTYCTKAVDLCKTNNGGCAVDKLTGTALATCTYVPPTPPATTGTVTCACKPGFSGDGKTCADINECATNNGGCSTNATCTNSVGSFQCACKAGFLGDGKTCTDINECANANGGCSPYADCINTPGSSSCKCKAGYSGDGKTCTDINECTTTPPTCSSDATCVNSAGSFTCTCKAGYAGDGKTCTEINECATNNGGCAADALCTNTPGSFSCACKAGFSGDGKTCTDINECTNGTAKCGTNATCTNTPGSFQCACNAGFSGDGKICTDIDECPPLNYAWNFATQGQGAWVLDPPSVAGTDVGWKLLGGNLYYGNAAGTSFDTPNMKNSGSATGPAITFTNHPSHRLTFDLWMQTEGGGFDNLTVYVVVGGQPIAVWIKAQKQINMGQWNPISVILPGYAGKQGNLKFTFDTIDQISNAMPGVKINNLKLQGAGQPCDANAACANTVGSYTCTCEAGFVGDGKTCKALGSDATVPADSCLQMQSAGQAVGNFFLKTPVGAKQFYCENGWARVTNDGFEGGAAGPWTPAQISACGAYGNILGGANIAGMGAIYTATVTDVPAHASVRVLGTYLAIDTWDGEKAWAKIDGLMVWSQAFTNIGTNNQCGLATSGEQTGYIQGVAAGNTPKFTVQIGSDLNQPANDEAFAADNVTIWVQ